MSLPKDTWFENLNLLIVTKFLFFKLENEVLNTDLREEEDINGKKYNQSTKNYWKTKKNFINEDFDRISETSNIKPLKSFDRRKNDVDDILCECTSYSKKSKYNINCQCNEEVPMEENNIANNLVNVEIADKNVINNERRNVSESLKLTYKDHINDSVREEFQNAGFMIKCKSENSTAKAASIATIEKNYKK